jgi:hypothetical protein
MQCFTYGHLKITTAHVDTSTSLRSLRDGMRSSTYPSRVPGRGWAALRWKTEVETPPSISRTNPGEPSIETINDERLLLARFYIDRENRTLLRQVGPAFEDMPAGVRYIADSVDVIVRQSDSLDVFISTHDEDDVQIILGRLRQAGDSEDWSVTGPVNATPDSDLFLWMIERWTVGNGKLAKDLVLVDFSSVSTRSHEGKITRSLRGIDLDRVDTLGAVADDHYLGPAKFVLYDKTVGMTADLFLLLDGTFDIYRRSTEYDDEPLDGSTLGIRSAVDITTGVLPKLHAAHAADKEWVKDRRAKFQKRCARRLHTRFAP